MKPFLLLQLRPETDAADAEYRSILARCGIAPEQVRRVRLDQQDLPAGLDLDAHAGVIVGGGPGCVSDAPEKKTPVEARIEAQVLSAPPKSSNSPLYYQPLGNPGRPPYNAPLGRPCARVV